VIDWPLVAAIAVALVAGSFWLGWTACVDYHKRKRRRRPRPKPLPPPPPPPTMRPSRPAGDGMLASTYQDGGSHKRSLVRHRAKKPREPDLISSESGTVAE
jgi:hypothetical protein